MKDITALIDDLEAEQSALDEVVRGFDEAAWDRLTPAEGWTIRHQIAHLSFFDAAAVIALTRPDDFAEQRAAADLDPEGYGRDVLKPFLAVSSQELMKFWREGRAELNEALRQVQPGVRVPWYGPAMSVASMTTARLMETWAHGQDVADAVGVQRDATRRLEHVARLACLARPYSYLVRDRPTPEAAVRVELTRPDAGGTWSFGDVEALDVVKGPMLDFCLVLTRRRHVADTEVRGSGAAAEEWLKLGQAYAGSPGSGRAPGQFR